MGHFAYLQQSSRQLRTLGLTQYFHEYRPGLPEEVIDVLVGAARRDGDADTLLDLGTGTGQVVRALHPYFRDVIAVEPVEDMFDLARRDLPAQVGPGTQVRVVHGRAEQFTPPDGWTPSLVTICRAFHWMDQPQVLDRLARFVPPSGVVAIFTERGFWRTPTPWKHAMRAVILDFLGAEHGLDRVGFSYDDERHGETLARSPFNDVQDLVVPVRRSWTSDSILGYLYSRARTARLLYGDRIDEFEREVRKVLADYSDDDTFSEDNEFVMCLGRKPRA